MHRKSVTFRCSNCLRIYPYGFHLTCERCGGLVDPVYDLDRATLFDSDNPLSRYFALVPVQDERSLARVSIGFTPCIHARRLGSRIGLRALFLKDETRHPTRTTKDR